MPWLVSPRLTLLLALILAFESSLIDSRFRAFRGNIFHRNENSRAIADRSVKNLEDLEFFPTLVEPSWRQTKKS